MPGANFCARFENRQGCSDLHQDDDGGSDSNGRHGMHHGAQRTMVGIGDEGMDVGNLGDCQKRQKDEAHDRNHRK